MFKTFVLYFPDTPRILGNDYNLAEKPISVVQQFIGKCCLGAQTMFVVRTKLKPQIIFGGKHWCWRSKL
jgi:hypothetical protein